MEYRRIRQDEFQQVVDLQNRNLISVLNPEDQLEGFLATQFTLEQFKQMDNALCIVVCVNDNKICGYLCASTIAFNQQFVFPAAMLERCSRILYQNKSIMSYRFFIPSPTCIEREYRGQEVFNDLCKKLVEHLPYEYELAVTFVSTKNLRSLQAIKKVGMEVIDEFEINDNRFWILVCPSLGEQGFRSGKKLHCTKKVFVDNS
jgi:hypothetical protein